MRRTSEGARRRLRIAFRRRGELCGEGRVDAVELLPGHIAEGLDWIGSRSRSPVSSGRSGRESIASWHATSSRISACSFVSIGASLVISMSFTSIEEAGGGDPVSPMSACFWFPVQLCNGREPAAVTASDRRSCSQVRPSRSAVVGPLAPSVGTQTRPTLLRGRRGSRIDARRSRRPRARPTVRAFRPAG
jgi:hypothetical protein